MKYITRQELWDAALQTQCPPNYTWRHRGLVVTVFDSGKYHNQVEVTVSWPLGTVLLVGGWLDQQWIDFTGKPMFGYFLTSRQSHLTACGIIAAAWNSRKGESIIYAVRPDTAYGIERAKPVRGDWCGACNSYQYSGRCRCGNICETCGNAYGDGDVCMCGNQ